MRDHEVVAAAFMHEAVGAVLFGTAQRFVALFAAFNRCIERKRPDMHRLGFNLEGAREPTEQRRIYGK